VADDIILPQSDEAWFREHPDRNFRIRAPKDAREFAYEFSSIGADNYPRERRAVIAMRSFTAGDEKMFGRPGGLLPRIMQIPFLKFADETIEDNDKTLAPIVREMMGQAKGRYGL